MLGARTPLRAHSGDSDRGRWPKLLGLTLGLRGIPRFSGACDLPEPLGPGGNVPTQGNDVAGLSFCRVDVALH